MGLFTPDFDNLRELYTTTLQRQLNSEKQIVEGLQEMIEKSTSQQLAALISGAQSNISSAKDEQIRDVVLIAAGNEIEHHEIANYGTLVNWAMVLGEQKHAELLSKTLEEEKGADKILTKLANQINVAAPVA